MNNPFDLNDISRTLHPTIAQHIFFASAQGTVTKIEHVTRHQAGLDKFQRIELYRACYSLTKYNQNKIK